MHDVSNCRLGMAERRERVNNINSKDLVDFGLDFFRLFFLKQKHKRRNQKI